MQPDARTLTRTRRVKAALGRAGRWMLFMVVLCLALIGFLHLTRGTEVQHVRGVAADGVPIGVSEPQFPLVVTMMTGAWLASGNRVEVTLNGDGPCARLWQNLRSARQSITRQLYCGAPGRIAATLQQILLEAGVRVYEWQPSILHAKTFVVGGEWSTIGSMNFDNRSMALNDEATLMVAGSNSRRADGSTLHRGSPIC